MEEIQSIIQKLDLEPHPEGGYYKETYRSEGIIKNENLTSEFKGDRNYCTSIYFLLTSDNFSAFHKINQDEMWHYYKGTPIKLHIISSEGIYSNVIIGNNIEDGEFPQFVVKAKDWFAAEVLNPNTYSLVGCTVSPGFDFRDFKLAQRNQLAKLFPDHKALIKKFTRV